MKCKISLKILALYVSGELSQRKAQKIAAHLKECDECDKKVEELKWSHNVVKNNIELPDMSVDFWQQVKSETMAKIRADSQVKRSFITPFISRYRFAVATVSVLLIVISAVILYFTLFTVAPTIPTPEEKSKPQTLARERSTPPSQAQRKDEPVPDERLAANHMAEESPASETSKKQESTQAQTSQDQLISQDREEQQIVVTFHYEDPEIKVIWIYKS